MKKCRRMLAAEQTGKLDLAAGRVEQILTAYDEVYALQPVIDDDRKLIRPVAVSIASEHITALLERPLLLRPEPNILEPLDALNPASRGCPGRARKADSSSGTFPDSGRSRFPCASTRTRKSARDLADRRARAHTHRLARFAVVSSPSATNPSHARSSSSAASNSGRLRARS